MDNHDTYQTGLRLWHEWTRMWNGAPELARELVAPRFVLHLTLPAVTPPASISDPAGVEQWVRTHCAKFDRLVFLAGCGPFVDVRAGIVAGPWIADAVVQGQAQTVCGMDTIAFRAGKITEYWTLSKPSDGFGAWNRALML